MKFTKQQAAEIKAWTVKRVEHISDADAEVLADYVLALLTSDAPEEQIRKETLYHLDDFTKEHTKSFVDDLFARYAAKRITKPPTHPTPPTRSLAQPYLPSVPKNGRITQISNAKLSRKRPFGESNGYDTTQAFTNGDRNPKRVAKVHMKQTPLQPQVPTAFMPQGRNTSLSQPLTPSNGSPQWPSPNAMSFLWAMQSKFPDFNQFSSSPTGFEESRGGVSSMNRQRCPAYEVAGFCFLGNICPYDHGTVQVMPQSEDGYDPNNAMIDSSARNRQLRLQSPNTAESQHRVHLNNAPLKAERKATFSDPRLPDSLSFTSIVVEKIPQQNFDEKQVQTFFAQFGTITNIVMKPSRYLAIVDYAIHTAARRAWESPKVVFDNRFVKVYWYRPDLVEYQNGPKMNRSAEKSGYGSTYNSPRLLAEAVSDLDPFKRLQTERQKIHVERHLKLQELYKAKDSLQDQRRKLSKRCEEEKETLYATIASKTGTFLDMETTEQTKGSLHKTKHNKTQALRDHLARLEAEAKSIGIDPDTVSEAPFFGQISSYRRRGSSTSRGTYFSYRSGHPGSCYRRGRDPAVRKLDNRPRNVVIRGIALAFDKQKDESLRAYLVNIQGFKGIAKDIDGGGQRIARFQERWQAEQLMNGTHEIPGVGKIETAWIAETPPVSMVMMKEDSDKYEDVAMSDFSNERIFQDMLQEQHEVNLDVAGEDEWDKIS